MGFGTGNIRDDLMETLSKNGNGNYAYINSVEDAEKVLVQELAANLFVVAKDVKAQIEFNGANVSSYRLIGYENRMLTNQEFEEEATDAGEIGAGTDIVLLFEIELVNGTGGGGLKYGDNAEPQPQTTGAYADELFELRIRYKDPETDRSDELIVPATFEAFSADLSDDFVFAGAVAAFCHLLRGSDHSGDITLNEVIRMAERGVGRDRAGYRESFLALLESYETLID